MTKKNKIPMRRCIGCMESKPKKELIRLVYWEGSLNLDPGGRAKGRGAYVCGAGECFDKAVKRGAFARAFKGAIDDADIKRIREELGCLQNSKV